MNTQKLIELIKATQPNPGKKGKLFTVTFTKKDGTDTTKRARLGVQRNLTGKGMSFDPATKGLMTVWSAGDQGYRMLNLNTTKEIKIGRKTYTIR